MAELHVLVCVAFDHRSDAGGLERFKSCISKCEFVEVAMEVSGTFDMIVQGRFETLAAYTEQMDRIRPQLAAFVSRLETNFVCKKIERKAAAEKTMWVPCVGGRKRIDIGMIDKVVAEGDYMRLYIQDWHCLIHTTIHALKAQLDARFIQLHRSSIVRIDFIDRLLHRDRRWIARLRDGSQQSVAKSHVAKVMDLLGHDSSKDKRITAKTNLLVEEQQQSVELQMQVMH
jgi:DNA-binding LytR/AlgR family response regulator